MKKLFLPLLLVSSFALAQNNDRVYPIMLVNKVDTLNKKVNLAGLFLEQSANYQEKSLNIALLGMICSPIFAYIGFNSNNKEFIYISYAMGISCSIASLHFKFKSIESLREASIYMPYQSYKPLN